MSLVRNDAAGGAENAGETPSTAARSPSLRKGGESGLSYERAANEVIADACEMVLNNEKMLARLEKDNAKLARSFRDYMRSFLRKIRKAFTGAEATHAEAKAMQGVMRDLAKVWGEGVFGEGEAVGAKNATTENAAQESGGKMSLKDAVDKAIQDKGDKREKKKPVGITPVSSTAVGMVRMASAGNIDISNQQVAVYLDDIWHSFKRHSDPNIEQTRDQIALTQKDIENAVLAVNQPDVVESLFNTTQNPTQKQGFAYAKKTSAGYYVVVEAVSRPDTGKVFPVEIIQVSQNKWNNWIGQGKTLGEMLYEHDKKKLAALDIAANKKNRVTAAQYARLSGPAPSAFSSVNTNIPNGKLSVKEESTRFSLKDEDAVSDRELLANTLASVAKNPASPTSRKAHDYP